MAAAVVALAPSLVIKATSSNVGAATYPAQEEPVRTPALQKRLSLYSATLNRVKGGGQFLCLHSSAPPLHQDLAGYHPAPLKPLARISSLSGSPFLPPSV